MSPKIYRFHTFGGYWQSTSGSIAFLSSEKGCAVILIRSGRIFIIDSKNTLRTIFDMGSTSGIGSSSSPTSLNIYPEKIIIFPLCSLEKHRKKPQSWPGIYIFFLPLIFIYLPSSIADEKSLLSFSSDELQNTASYS